MIFSLFIAGAGNLIDLVSTLRLTHLGYTEVNPVMAALLPHPVLFALVKICGMTVALWILWKNRESKVARITAWAAAGLYGLIAVYYLAVFPVLV